MADSSVWDALTSFESVELIKRDYLRRHGRSANSEHAREIASPFVHARSYFKSAKNSELTVRPLLLYYGAISFSRGLTLMLSRGKREATLKPSHGIEVRSWHQSLEQQPSDFSGLGLRILKNGSLPELVRATQNRSLLRSNTSAVNVRYPVPAPKPGSYLTLGDLLSREPSIREHSHQWTGQLNCAPIAIEKTGENGTARVKLLKYGKSYIDRKLADRVFLDSPFVFEAEGEDSFVYCGPDSLDLIPPLTDFVNERKFGIGDLWITAPLPDGLKLTKIASLFSIAYSLGMLVRYYPKHWTSLIRSQTDDAALPTFLAAVDVIENCFPKLVLDHLNEATDER